MNVSKNKRLRLQWDWPVPLPLSHEICSLILKRFSLKDSSSKIMLFFRIPWGMVLKKGEGAR